MSFLRYFSRYTRVIWKCVEISKRIYINKQIQWWTDQHRLMPRTPCNAVTDHEWATDPRLKTPALQGSHLANWIIYAIFLETPLTAQWSLLHTNIKPGTHKCTHNWHPLAVRFCLCCHYAGYWSGLHFLTPGFVPLLRQTGWWHLFRCFLNQFCPPKIKGAYEPENMGTIPRGSTVKRDYVSTMVCSQ